MSNSAITGPTLIDFPAGMVMPYAGSTTPAGWLECNGSEVDISAYPALAAALGSTWNTAKNPLTGANYAAPAAGKFRVPDMRGAFLRGSSGGANNAQGVATGLAEFQSHKTAKNGLGTVSVSGLKNQMNGGTGLQSADHGHNQTGHAHNLTVPDGGAGVPFGSGYTVGGPAERVSTAQIANILGVTANHSHSWDFGGSATFSATGASATGDAETRPDAVGVRYLIKF